MTQKKRSNAPGGTGGPGGTFTPSFRKKARVISLRLFREADGKPPPRSPGPPPTLAEMTALFRGTSRSASLGVWAIGRARPSPLLTFPAMGSPFPSPGDQTSLIGAPQRFPRYRVTEAPCASGISKRVLCKPLFGRRCRATPISGN
jgi:hypothetical protein